MFAARFHKGDPDFDRLAKDLLGRRPVRVAPLPPPLNDRWVGHVLTSMKGCRSGFT
jgi:hypothetical protein